MCSRSAEKLNRLFAFLAPVIRWCIHRALISAQTAASRFHILLLSLFFNIFARAECSRYASASELKEARGGTLLILRVWFRVVSRHDGATRFSLKSPSYIFGFSSISVLTDADYYAVGLRHRDLLEQADATAVSTFRLADSRLALLVEEAGLVHVCRWKDYLFFFFLMNVFAVKKYTRCVRCTREVDYRMKQLCRSLAVDRKFIFWIEGKE